MKFYLLKIIAQHKATAPIDCPKNVRIFHAPDEETDEIPLLPVYRKFIKHIGIKPDTAPKPLTFQQIKTLFIHIKKHYRSSEFSMNCEARCFDIIQLLFLLSQSPLKYQIHGMIPIPSEAPPSAESEWYYHEAPAVRSDDNVFYVLDAALLEPMTESNWLGRVCGFNKFTVHPVSRVLYLPRGLDICKLMA